MIKNFGDLGDFKGQVVDVDEHDGKPGMGTNVGGGRGVVNTSEGRREVS